MSNIDEVPEALLASIKDALRYAELAVDSDIKQDYANSIINYKETIRILEEELQQIPQEKQSTKMKDLIKQYRSRIETLQESMPSLAGIKKLQNTVVSNIDFVEENRSKATLSEPPPSSTMYKPFWLMRILSQTIRSGGYLTPNIYIPKIVWFQEFKIPNVGLKAESCEIINEWLLKLKDILVSDEKELITQLEAFSADLRRIQNTLSKSISGISEYSEKIPQKKDKKVNKLKKGKSNQVDEVGYVLLLLEIFDHAQIFEEWMKNEDYGYTVIFVKRISDFFYSVLCNFVVRDLHTLLVRYMRQAKESLQVKKEK